MLFAAASLKAANMPPVVLNILVTPSTGLMICCPGNGIVDGADFLILQQNIGKTPASPGWYAPADIDKDGTVGASDIAIWNATNGSTTDLRADLDAPRAVAQLTANVLDDGMPNPPGVLSSTWSVVSGNANAVKFSNAHSSFTWAAFLEAGTYGLLFTVSDGQSISTGTISVSIAPHTTTSVNAGTDQTVYWNNSHGDGDVDGTDYLIWQRHFGSTPGTAAWYAPADMNGNGVVDAADYPIWRNAYGSTYTLTADIDYGTKTLLTGTVSPMYPVQWRKVSGPGLATIANASATVTMVSFSSPGIYVFELTSHDCLTSVSDQVVVHVILYAPPIIDAGPDREIAVNQPIELNVDVFISTDFPGVSPVFTYLWTIVSGPTTPSFSNPAIPNPTISFPQPGTYVLDVSVFDGTTYVHDQIIVIVTAPSGPPQSGPLGDSANLISPNNPIISFPINVNQSGDVRVKVYDHMGDLIKTLFDGFLTAGTTHVISWDGSNLRNNEAGSGVYIVFFELPGQNIKKKVIVSR
jgi:hypothetical protein